MDLLIAAQEKDKCRDGVNVVVSRQNSQKFLRTAVTEEELCCASSYLYSYLYSGYRLSPGGKAVGAWR